MSAISSLDGSTFYVSLSTYTEHFYRQQIMYELDVKTRKVVLEAVTNRDQTFFVLLQAVKSVKSNARISRLKVIYLFDRILAAFVTKEIALNTNLCHLSFAGCAIDCDTLAAICCELQTNTTLKKLNLSRCNFRARGLDALAQFLSKNKSLQKVKLHRMRLEDESAAMRFYETIFDTNYTLLRVSIVEGRPETILLGGPPHGCGMSSRVLFPFDFIDVVQARLNKMCERNVKMRWCVIHPLIVDIVIALASAPLNLPAYVLLWIIDWLPHLERAHSELKKIRLIANVIESIRRVKTGGGGK
jgi:hypothetical protein